MKKFDFTKIVFLVSSILILLIGVLVPEGEVGSSVIAFLVILSLILFDIKASKILNLSKDNPKIKTVRLINNFTIGSILIISLFINMKSINGALPESIEVILVALFILFFGNLSPKIPFNRYIGLRLPWTIRDEDTFRIAHRLIGYLSIPCGILMLLCAYFNNTNLALIFFFSWILIPSLYSLNFYNKKLKNF
ncbi:SdpI family protein [Clostridium sp.]|uniref:SdpI family protein n=1 Tax=Clostridium sp. TaxID=1506 RepID=UPI003991FA6D